jgi:aryl-alcohol dehydrogenase-like predicted oxidoreductase
MGVLTYSPLMQGMLSGRWKTVEDIPDVRRRTRHFASEREGTRHGVPGCESQLIDALKGIEQAAADFGRSMAETALAWLLARPGVASVIVGGRKPDQVARNAAAAGIELDAPAVARLDAVTRPLKEQLGANADPWLAGADSRIR